MEILTASIGAMSVQGDPRCVVVRNIEETRMLRLEQEDQLAIDAEGVRLSRHGRVSVVQIATKDGKCFLFDVVGLSRSSPLITYLKQLLENRCILKLIHDCRIDADALYHHFGITLANIMDTQVCEQLINVNGERCNLNAALEAHGLAVNNIRNCNVYDHNEAYWEVRPMTDEMIEWASEDVLKLHALFASQMKRFQQFKTNEAKAKTLSEEATRVLRGANTYMTRLPRSQIGRFIGKGGCNIRHLERVSKCYYYLRGSSGDLLVYYPHDAALKKAKKLLRSYREEI